MTAVPLQVGTHDCFVAEIDWTVVTARAVRKSERSHFARDKTPEARFLRLIPVFTIAGGKARCELTRVGTVDPHISAAKRSCLRVRRVG